MMKARHFYIVLLTLIIISVAGIVGAFLWGKGQLESNADSVSLLLAERDAQRENIILLQKAEAQSGEIDEVNELLDKLLPATKNQETLILDVIYTATSEAGIPLSNIVTFSFSGGGNPDALSGTQPYKEIPGVLEYPFNLEIKDIPYETLLVLLTEIEQNGRIVQIDTVQITPSKADPGLLSSVGLTMKAYVKP
jgi:Tfp pilus assembly protein PilO